MENDYITLNRHSWNERTPHHIASAFYGMESFLNGRSTLKSIDRELLGDVKGKSVLHLQCHFGQDTLSLARLGAKTTGVDFSDKAIEAAKNFNNQLALDARFICCDLYSLPEHLDEQFDIVYTSYGTIGWLPDMSRWAEIVARFLKSGGTFILIEFHPVVWMFDEDFKTIACSYFNNGPIAEESSGTYADSKAPVSGKTIGWNHSLSEVMGALRAKGLSITDFREYDHSPYNCFKNMKQLGDEEFVTEQAGNKLPMLYAVTAVKK